MGRGARTAGKEPPVSVAVTKQQKQGFAAEARRRGLGVSTTIRTLALERANELREQRQRERARRWQTERMRALADRIEAGEVGEASQEEIDAVFEEAEARGARRRPSAATA
mgnify:CR=1 FL=1